MLHHLALRFRKSLPFSSALAAMAYFIVVIFTTIQEYGVGKTANKSIFEPVQQEQILTETKQMDFMLIKDWHLFGQPDITATQKGGPYEIPQETQLQLKLLGVFFMPSPEKTSYAIIEAEDQIQKIYRAGDSLANGITLESIAREQVILLRNSQRESLSMEKTNLLAKT